MMGEITIIGAGLAGLSAALTLAKQNISCNLVSVQASERAQSVLAEGGINAALNVMDEEDSPDLHFEDTVRGGVRLADPQAIRGMTDSAPEIIRELARIGVPFAMEGGRMIQRNFGGQKKKRTSYCKSSTGKALMTAMIDAVRQYEPTLIRRYPHHRMEDLIVSDDICTGVWIRDTYTGEACALPGPVILAFGGPCGMLPGHTTGTTANDGNGLAVVFSRGVEAANLEFIQYHPTTVGIAGKRLLISEAARGEGGRLFIMRHGSPWYFMEERYPQLGNLMPRDVVSREMVDVAADPDCTAPVFLDLTGLPAETWHRKLPDLREQVRHYMGIDPAAEPLPVSPGIHFFMGGIRVDVRHRTNLPGLLAAGECACQYHGANRLGGNSLLGALYGGRVAAAEAASMVTVSHKAGQEGTKQTMPAAGCEAGRERTAKASQETQYVTSAVPQEAPPASPVMTAQLTAVLAGALGITRDAGTLQDALRSLEHLRTQSCTETDRRRILLGEAMLRSALAREESRGAHRRADFPELNDAAFRRTTVAAMRGGTVQISFQKFTDSDDI